MVSRPTYETKSDRQNEFKVARYLANREGLLAVSMPLRYAVDYAVVNDSGDVHGWYEIKCRTNPMKAYDTYLLSIGKYHSMLALQHNSGFPVFLAVKWTDCLGVMGIPAKHTISMGGRKDRGDWQDTEPCAMFPIEQFKVLAKAKGLHNRSG